MCEGNVGLRLICNMGVQVRISGGTPYKEGGRGPEERSSVFIDVSEE